MKVYYNDKYMNYRVFHEMLSTVNFFGIMIRHDYSKKGVIFVKVSIFWDTPICFFITYDGDIVNEFSDRNMSDEDLFKIYEQESEQVLYLMEIIDHLGLPETLFKKIALIAFERYQSSKNNILHDAVIFYKKMAYSNIKCVTIPAQLIPVNNDQKYYLLRMHAYWRKRANNLYMIVNQEGMNARDVFKFYDLSKVYRSLVDSDKKSELFLSDILSTKRIENVLGMMHNAIYAQFNTSLA